MVELEFASVQRVVGEFEDADLGDPRRTRRLLEMVAKFAARPDLSLPNTFETEAELEAVYRFIGNEAFDFDDLLESHRERTVERAERAGRVLALHDTTKFKFTHADPRKVGYLSTGKAGFLAHMALIVDSHRHRRPLGVLHVEPISRQKRSGRGSRKRHLSGRETAQWKDRESERWFRGAQACEEQLSNCSVVHIMDREGDQYELLSQLLQLDGHFVIRSNHDRKLATGKQSLRVSAKQQPVLLEREVHLSRRLGSSAPRWRASAPPREARTTTLGVKATTVTLRKPRVVREELSDELTINVVHVEELNPPAGEKPVVWTLLTSEPIETPQQVSDVIDMYRYRWLIEEFFKVIKTGCEYEQRKFATLHPMLNLLAITLPVALELLWIRSRVSDDPDGSAEELVTEQQLELLRVRGHRQLPAEPTAAQVLLAIASIGGHLKRNGNPGWQVLYRGYKRFLEYEAIWLAGVRAGRSSATSKRRNL